MSITIGSKVQSANGSWRSTLQKDGVDLEWKASELTTMPWQPNSYDPESDTLDFCFKPTAELLSFLANLKAAVLAQVSKDSELYFGARMAPEKVTSSFQSSLKTSQKGMDHFKGRYANIKFWDKNSKPMKEPTVWGSDDQCQLVIRATAVWFNDRGWGIAFGFRHLKILTTECPFSSR